MSKSLKQIREDRASPAPRMGVGTLGILKNRQPKPTIKDYVAEAIKKIKEEDAEKSNGKTATGQPADPINTRPENTGITAGFK
jgi:hypothetical protein